MAPLDAGRAAAKPRLVLITPAVEDAGGFAPGLAAACAAADVAAVILRLAPAPDPELLARLAALVPAVQRAGAAAILEGFEHLVTSANADGMHLTDSEAVGAARTRLGRERIVGAGNLANRHASMVAGESGADYLLFGEPRAAYRPPLADLIERVSWWAEIFEIPCVAYAVRREEIVPLARAGADFIALGEDLVWGAPDGPAAAVTAASRALAAERVP